MHRGCYTESVNFALVIELSLKIRSTESFFTEQGHGKQHSALHFTGAFKLGADAVKINCKGRLNVLINQPGIMICQAPVTINFR